MSNLQPVHWLKVGFDIGSCLVLFLFFQTLKIFAKPFKSSFYCNDYSVNMPFKPSTVTNGALILIVFCFPFLVLISTEFVRTLYIRRTANATTTTTNTNNQSSSNGVNRTRFVYKVKCFDNKILDVSEHLGNLYINCGAFFFGIAVVAVITDFVKYLVGRLRPNFLDVCQPNVDPYRVLCAKQNLTYLVPDKDFKCMSRDLPSIEESRLSFPSGHSSLSFYSMLFLILFIQQTWKCTRFGLMPRLIQFCLFSLAVFISLSRLIDNKHHPSDVIAGALLGTLVSVLTFRYLTDLLKRNNYKVVECFGTSSNSSSRGRRHHHHHHQNRRDTDHEPMMSLSLDGDADERSTNEVILISSTSGSGQSSVKETFSNKTSFSRDIGRLPV